MQHQNSVNESIHEKMLRTGTTTAPLVAEDDSSARDLEKSGVTTGSPSLPPPKQTGVTHYPTQRTLICLPSPDHLGLAGPRYYPDPSEVANLTGCDVEMDDFAKTERCCILESTPQASASSPRLDLTEEELRFLESTDDSSFCRELYAFQASLDNDDDNSSTSSFCKDFYNFTDETETDISSAPPEDNFGVEVVPGCYQQLRGREETCNALELGLCTEVTCLECRIRLVCVQDCDCVLCPHCSSLTPVDSKPGANGTHQGGCGIGIHVD